MPPKPSLKIAYVLWHACYRHMLHAVKSKNQNFYPCPMDGYINITSIYKGLQRWDLAQKNPLFKRKQDIYIVRCLLCIMKIRVVEYQTVIFSLHPTIQMPIFSTVSVHLRGTNILL